MKCNISNSVSYFLCLISEPESFSLTKEFFITSSSLLIEETRCRILCFSSLTETDIEMFSHYQSPALLLSEIGIGIHEDISAHFSVGMYTSPL